MSGLIMKLSLKDMGAGKAVKQLAERIERPQEFLREAGIYLLSSVQRNFQAQGRPVLWERSKRAIAQHGQTLRDTGRLMNSVTMKVFNNILRIGTNVIYAAIQHFGGTIDKEVSVKSHVRYYKHSKASIRNRKVTYSTVVKAHSIQMNTTIPARPYMMAQAEDWPVIVKIGQDYFIPVRFAA